MHKNFDIIDIKNLDKSQYELLLYRKGIIYKLNMDLTRDYIENIKKVKQIDLKDDSWLDEHLIEVRKTIFYNIEN